MAAEQTEYGDIRDVTYLQYLLELETIHRFSPLRRRPPTSTRAFNQEKDLVGAFSMIVKTSPINRLHL